MAGKLYTKQTWVDEVLAGIATYLLKDDAGDTVYEEASIELATGVITPGTSLTAARMNNIEDGIDALDDLLVALQNKFTFDAATELTIVSGAITATQTVHKLQPETGTTDDLDTISGLSEGDVLILYVSDAGTDTITIKHGTGNISCLGASDVDLSQGSAIFYSDGTTVYLIGGGGGGADIGQNSIINGNFIIAQRGTTFTAATVPANSDDTYLLDRFILLSDGNDIVDVSQELTAANLPVGAVAGAKFDIETEGKKWGILQILEAKDSAALIGGTVSLSFKACRGASDTSTLLRAAILSWSSTADTVTSDIVNDWGDEGTNPTLVANWTFENTPAALAELTDAWQTYKIENIAIDTASAANVAVFIWSEDKTNAVGDLVYITDIKLELGAVATAFVPRPYEQELILCKRYCQSVYMPTFVANGTTTVYGFTSLQNEMFSAPTITQLVALGITDVVSANFSQSAPNITPIYAGTKAIAANYGNFTGLVSGRLYFNQPSASDGPTLLVAEL